MELLIPATPRDFTVSHGMMHYVYESVKRHSLGEGSRPVKGALQTNPWVP